MTLSGIDGHVVDVEADVASGLPAFTVTGLPDASLGEARDRVRAACHNSEVALPPRRITVNLSPASLRKAGTSFDVAIAVAVLAAGDVIPHRAPEGVVHLGELGLDGRVRAVRGVLPMVLAAARAGVRRVVVPMANVAEASLVTDVEVFGARSLAGSGGRVPGRAGAGPRRPARTTCDDDAAPVRRHRCDVEPSALDLADVVGQVEARHALEVAAAGSHHLFLLGPPGAGKTMLAARLPGLLPDLDDASALEVTAVHSLAGALPAGCGLVAPAAVRRPAPHVVAGRRRGRRSPGVPRPGAASRAHRGVLFLDEAPEFDVRVLDALRQPLENGELVIHRAAGHARYPARFQLVMAANPCPCGNASGKGVDCTCTPIARRRYLHRLSGPLLDRVDLQVQVLPGDPGRPRRRRGAGEPDRAGGRTGAAAPGPPRPSAGPATSWRVNAEVPGHELRRGRLAAAGRDHPHRSTPPSSAAP